MYFHDRFIVYTSCSCSVVVCVVIVRFCPCTSRGEIKRTGWTYHWNSWCSYSKQSALVDNNPIKRDELSQQFTPTNVLIRTGKDAPHSPQQGFQSLTRWTEAGKIKTKYFQWMGKSKQWPRSRFAETCVWFCFGFCPEKSSDSSAST